jgi:hypothetical protein
MALKRLLTNRFEALGSSRIKASIMNWHRYHTHLIDCGYCLAPSESRGRLYDLSWIKGNIARVSLDFRSRSSIARYLRTLALDDLRNELCMQHDLAYAMETDDCASMQYCWTNRIPECETASLRAARAAHQRHLDDAHAKFPRLTRESLNASVPMRRALLQATADQVFQNRLNLARCERDAIALLASMAVSPPVARRARL